MSSLFTVLVYILYMLLIGYDICYSDETDGDIVSNYFRKKGKRWGLLSMLKTAQETVLPQRVKKGY